MEPSAKLIKGAQKISFVGVKQSGRGCQINSSSDGSLPFS